MSLRSFSEFNKFTEEAAKTLYVSFGRFSPPTIGHGKLIDFLATQAKKNRADYKLYASATHDKKKNPLKHNEKIVVLKKMFPKHKKNISADPAIKTFLQAATSAFNSGYTRLVFVVGQDRIKEFDKLLQKYNGTESNSLFNFDSVEVISAGNRDPESEGVEGMSASKVRDAAVSGDYDSFVQGLPKTFADEDARRLYDLIRNRLNIKESFYCKDSLRDKYIKGHVLNIGDTCWQEDTELIIKERGPNFVTCFATNNHEENRYWLTDLQF
jgi:hypothetical protein